MRAVVNIEIEDVHLAELGVEQAARYVPFAFNTNQFVGYWVGSGNQLHAYIGGDIFICKASQKNIDLFESILNYESSSSNNNVQQVRVNQADDRQL